MALSAPPRTNGLPTGLLRDSLLAAGIAITASLAVFGPILKNLGDSWGPGDMLSHYVNVDTWSLFGHATDTHYGFPAGMNQNLFPGVDITQNTFAAAVSGLTGNPFAGINLLIIISFPLVAALAVVAFRLMGLSGWWAIALSTAYTFIPYHWGRSLGHVYLGTMYAAVTGVIIALLVGTGRLRRDHLTRRTLIGLIVLVIITAWSNIYYAAFGFLLACAAAAFRFLRGDSGRDLGRALVPALGVACVTIVGLIPALIARAGESDIGRLGARAAYDSVLLAGNLSMALLPAPTSELPYMGYYNSAVYRFINEAPALENISLTNFGTWITTAAAIFVIAWWLRQVRSRNPLPEGFLLVSFLAGVTIAFFIPWGLNAIVAEFLTAQIRAWNRLIPTLLLLLLLAAGVALSRSRRLMHTPVAVWAPLGLLVIILVEQVWPWRNVYVATVDRYSQETTLAREYAQATNGAIPEECGIVQIPRMIYPENGPVPPELNDYEHFWQPLTNRGKDFSFGAIAFTSADAVLSDIRGFPAPEAINALRDVGFCAVHVDLRGIEEDRRATFVNNVQSTLGSPVATGHEGDWLLYELPQESA